MGPVRATTTAHTERWPSTSLTKEAAPRSRRARRASAAPAAHEGRRHHRPRPAGPDGGAQVGVQGVDQVEVEQVGEEGATPAAVGSCPNSAIIRCGRPLDRSPPPMRGLTPATGVPLRAARMASRTPATCGIGPGLTKGLLGRGTIISASAIASSSPGAGRASSIPRTCTAEMGTDARSLTKYSWKCTQRAPARLHPGLHRLVGHG